MRLLILASEAVPFVKTGGLADVAGALAQTLHRRGHDVRLALPRYSDIDRRRYHLLEIMGEMNVQWGQERLTGSVFRCPYPGSDMPVYFVHEPSMFDRKGLYGNGKADFPDNHVRFGFFTMAALWMLKGLDWQPDVIIANDWQTGLLPVLLRHHPELARDPFYRSIKSVFLIHNLAYQGNFDKFLLPALGLPWEVFTQDGLEFYGRASYLKSGLVFSDALVAVSPTYAREIQTEEFGAGLDGTLRIRSAALHGILNGIDDGEWNPATDRHVARPFGGQDLAGKAECKRALQAQLGLPQRADVPVVGMISRLVVQKGFDLVHAALEDLAARDAQYVVLGSGEPEFEEGLKQAAERHPDRFAVRLGYDGELSHRIVAGADLFLMPSSFEPCGLTQMYAMRYGTVPVARRTGGLADTVVPATEAEGTGFLFENSSGEEMLEALDAALHAYRHDPSGWRRLQANGMAKDFSWDASAAQYEELFARLATEGSADAEAH